MGRKKFFLQVILTLVGVGALLLVFGFIFVRHFSPFPKEETNTAKYTELRAAWIPKELVVHFPPTIPATASFSKFSHMPGFLQGGAHIQLRLRLATEEIQKLRLQFTAMTTKSFLADTTNDRVNYEAGKPPIFFATGDDKTHTFPDDYEIMVFDPVVPMSQRPAGFYWNHGVSHGVAISITRNEIVYFAEAW